MTESLFDQNNENAVQLDSDKDYLEELVGEGKKFSSVKDLAKGKAEADMYIETLKSRLDEMRQDYLTMKDEQNTGQTLRELIDQLKQQQNLASSDNTLNANEDNVNKPVIKPDEIENIVSSKIREFENQKKQEENFNKVKSRLLERYGNTYPNVVKQTVETLGLSDEDANSLARKSPEAFFKTLGLDSSKESSFQAPITSKISGDSFLPKTEKRTWAYYQKMKKENPKLYNDPKTTIQMHKDAISLGDAFRDGDYNLN